MADQEKRNMWRLVNKITEYINHSIEENLYIPSEWYITREEYMYFVPQELACHFKKGTETKVMNVIVKDGREIEVFVKA